MNFSLKITLHEFQSPTAPGALYPKYEGVDHRAAQVSGGVEQPGPTPGQDHQPICGKVMSSIDHPSDPEYLLIHVFYWSVEFQVAYQDLECEQCSSPFHTEVPEEAKGQVQGPRDRGGQEEKATPAKIEEVNALMKI